jgi:hypothetical protein
MTGTNCDLFTHKSSRSLYLLAALFVWACFKRRLYLSLMVISVEMGEKCFIKYTVRCKVT